MHNESEQAAARYERACDNYTAAKDMVKKAEEKLNQDERFLDSACQEMLNHATTKVGLINKMFLCFNSLENLLENYNFDINSVT